MSEATELTVRLYSMPRPAYLRGEVVELKNKFDHPFVRLYEIRVERREEGDDFAEHPSRMFLVVAEITNGAHGLPLVGRSPHILELQYQSDHGVPRLQELTVKSVGEWLAPKDASHYVLRQLKNELPGGIAYLIEDFLVRQLTEQPAAA